LRSAPAITLFVELGMALLAVRQLHVELFESGFGGDAALVQVVELRASSFGQFTCRAGHCGRACLVGQLATSAAPAPAARARFELASED
jgi:hypothetical protein